MPLLFDINKFTDFFTYISKGISDQEWGVQDNWQDVISASETWASWKNIIVQDLSFELRRK